MVDRSSLLATDPGRRLTVDRVQQTTFTPVRFGGLNSEQVTQFVRQVIAELGMRDNERQALLEENAQLRGELEESGGNPPPVEQQAVQIIVQAQRTADRLEADANQHAHSLVEDGRRHRAAYLADAREKAEGIVRSALDEAGREAAQLIAQAPIDAQRRMAYYKSLGEAWRDGLLANMQQLTAQMRAWEAQYAQGTAVVPDTGPHQASRDSGPHPVVN